MTAAARLTHLPLLLLLALAGGSKPTEAPAGGAPAGRAKAGGPTRSWLRIVRPLAGATVSQQFELVVETSADAVPSGVGLGIDGAPPAYSKTFSPTMIVDSSGWANGRHRLTASIVTVDGRILADNVEVVVSNAPFRVASYAVGKPFFQGGDTVWFDVRVTGETDAVSLAADFSQIDPTWKAGAERVEAVSIGVDATTFRVFRTLPARPGVRDGSYDLPIVVHGPKGVATSTVEIALRGLPPAPFELGVARGSDGWELAPFLDEPAPPARGGGSRPTVVEGRGPLEISDRPVTLRVRWARASPEVRRLIATVAGFAGWYSIPVAPDQEEATLTLRLPDSTPAFRPGPLPAGEPPALELSTQAGKGLSAPARVRLRLPRRAPSLP